jgi:hypothetical protein
VSNPLKPIGDRIKQLEGSMMRRGGVKDPTALAAYIGRKRPASSTIPGLPAKAK